MNRLRPSIAYALAAFLSVSVLGLSWSVEVIDHEIRLAVLLSAVATSAWVCGWRAGLLAILICSVGMAWSSLRVSDVEVFTELIRLSAFWTLSLLVLVITGLRQDAEESLMESETQLRAILDNSLDPIAVTHRGVHQFVNRAYARAFGYDSPRDLVGTSVLKVIAPAERRQILQRFVNRGAGKQNPEQYETSGLRADGREIDLEVHASSYQLKNDELVLVILRDITERKRARQERENLITDLQGALSKVKQLQGLLPTCSSCRQIRDEEGRWHQMEDYICQHSEADFSHGLCPTCAAKLYPEVFGSDKRSRSLRTS